MMRYCMQCGNRMGGMNINCPGCNARTDEFYARPLRNQDVKRENIMLAREHFLSEDYGAAVGLLSEIGIKEPKNINILYSLGRSLTNTKDYSRAMQVYDRALSIRPDSVNILYAKGQCYMELGDCKEAEKFFARSLELEPMFKNSREMMKKCTEDLYKQHDGIVRENVDDLIMSKKRTEAKYEKEPEDDIAGYDESASYRCGICGEVPRFEDQYQMWWCDSCSRYIEETDLEPYSDNDDEVPEAEWADEPSQYPCKECGTLLHFVHEYSMWWCDGCGKYVGGDSGAGSQAASAGQDQTDHSQTADAGLARTSRSQAIDENRCHDCGDTLRFIDQYRMWWCETCQKYIGEEEEKKDEHASSPPQPVEAQGAPTYPCRNCGTMLKFIDQYQRWWCDGCRNYV